MFEEIALPLDWPAYVSHAEANAYAKNDGEEGTHSTAVAGRVQGLAMTFGKGRVVVFGEAALFSAQVVTLRDGNQDRTFKAGMNVPGNDNRQFALNVVHWLSGLIN